MCPGWPTGGRRHAAVADGWPLGQRELAAVYEAVLHAAGVRQGTRLLDAGCRTGAALALAGRRGAGLAGSETAPGLLAAARVRVPAADLRLSALERLPFRSGSFDVVTAFGAVQYADDPVGALRQLRRVTAPGGRIAVVTWAEAVRCQSRAVLAAVGALLSPPPPGSGGPFTLSTPGRLERLLSAAGLSPSHAGEVPASFHYPDLACAVRAQLCSRSARAAVALAGWQATSAALRRALAGSRRPDGSYRQDNVFRYLIATT